jgi:hypothetical protein
MNAEGRSMERLLSVLLLVAVIGAGAWALAEMVRPENLLLFVRVLTLCQPG